MTKRDEIQKELGEKIKALNCNTLTDICPRTGKIRIMLNYVIAPTDNVLVVYPEIDIKQSWLDEFKKLNYDESRIKFCTSQSIKKYTASTDFLILDEYHDYSASQIYYIRDYIKVNRVKKVVGLSGSVGNETRDKWEEITEMKVGVSYPIKQAIQDGIISDYKIYLHTVPLSRIENIPMQYKGNKYLTSEKKKFDSISKKINATSNQIALKMLRLERMRIIKGSQSKLDYTKKLLKLHENERIIVFTGLIEIADKVGIPSYHSKSVDKTTKTRFINNEFNHLAAVAKLSMGTTFPKLAMSVINFFDSNPENMFQKINRITCLEYDNLEKKAIVHVISSDEPVELKWRNNALMMFDENKIFNYEQEGI